MAPKKTQLSDLMGDPDIIDLEDFSLGPVKEGEDPPPAIEPVTEPPPDPNAPDIQSLIKQVQELKTAFTEKPPEPTDPAEPPLAGPDPAEIAKAYEDNDIARAVELTLQKFTVDNFVPAIKQLSDNFESKSTATAADSQAALANAAAAMIKEKVLANPATAAIAPEIYEKFRGADAKHIMLPGVIENVIRSTVGEKAMKGEWSPGVIPPTDVGQGGAGPGAGDDEVSPEQMAVFERLTGTRGTDASIVKTLSRPHHINLGTGEG